MNELPPALQRYIRGLKQHDVNMISETVADDLQFVVEDRSLAKTQFLDMLRALYAAFPDWHYEHSAPEFRKEDQIAIRWRQGGTHLGTLVVSGRDPIKATGRCVVIPEQYFFYRMANRLIVEIRPDPIPDGAPQAIFQQIGLESPPV